MTIENTIDNDLKIIQELVYNPCGFSLSNFKQSSESLEYVACSFILNGKIIQYRNSKIIRWSGCVEPKKHIVEWFNKQI